MQKSVKLQMPSADAIQNSYMWNPNHDTNELIHETETDSTVREKTSGCQGVGVWGRDKWEFGVSKPKLLCMEWINKVLLYSTENNYVQYPMINHNRK